MYVCQLTFLVIFQANQSTKHYFHAQRPHASSVEAQFSLFLKKLLFENAGHFCFYLPQTYRMYVCQNTFVTPCHTSKTTFNLGTFIRIFIKFSERNSFVITCILNNRKYSKNAIFRISA